MKLHIVLVSTFYYPRMRGGTEHTLRQLAEILVKRGHRVTVLSFHDKPKVEFSEVNGVACRAFPVPNLSRCLFSPAPRSNATKMLWHLINIYNPVAGQLLARQLRELRPDVVQTHNLPGWSCSVWKAGRHGAPLHIQVLHDFQITCPSASRFREGQNCKSTCKQCAPFGVLPQQLSQQVSYVVANSAYTKKVHLDLGFFSRTQAFEVIHGAVTPAGAIERVPSPEPSRLRVGYLGRLHPTKGVDLLLRAFISAGRPDAVLRIAGRGTESEESELRAIASGHAVEFVGHQPAEDFLREIDLLVVPSLWKEPMGRVVIEAAMQGVPVLATANGGLPEMMEVGRTGWLFDSKEPEQLVRYLREISLGTLQQMEPSCRAWASKFTPEAIGDQWVALYQKLRAENSRQITTLAKDASGDRLTENR